MNGARRCLALFTVCARIAVPAHNKTQSAPWKRIVGSVAGAAALVCFAPAAYAADIGIYWNAANPQQDFAAGDVKAALTAKG
ncbi:MAG: hypothetical protein RL033_2739, partial [Pseudomonadota bacterium]